jgi:hypothetical protein
MYSPRPWAWWGGGSQHVHAHSAMNGPPSQLGKVRPPSVSPFAASGRLARGLDGTGWYWIVWDGPFQSRIVQSSRVTRPSPPRTVRSPLPFFPLPFFPFPLFPPLLPLPSPPRRRLSSTERSTVTPPPTRRPWSRQAQRNAAPLAPPAWPPTWRAICRANERGGCAHVSLPRPFSGAPCG